jgi:hypothetical protein
LTAENRQTPFKTDVPSKIEPGTSKTQTTNICYTSVRNTWARKLTGGSKKIIQKFSKKYIMRSPKILLKIYGVLACDAG